MLNDKTRKAIMELIALHQAANTVSAEVARDSLVREGIYAPDGQLTAEYGGPGAKRKRTGRAKAHP